MGCGANKGNNQAIAIITLTQQLGIYSDQMFQQKFNIENNTAQKTHLDSAGLTIFDHGDVYIEKPAKALLIRLETQTHDKPTHLHSILQDSSKTTNTLIKTEELTLAHKQNSIPIYSTDKQIPSKLPPIYSNRQNIRLLQGTMDLDYIEKYPKSFDFDFKFAESSSKEEKRKRDVMVDELLEDLDNI